MKALGCGLTIIGESVYVLLIHITPFVLSFTRWLFSNKSCGSRHSAIYRSSSVLSALDSLHRDFIILTLWHFIICHLGRAWEFHISINLFFFQTDGPVPGSRDLSCDTVVYLSTHTNTISAMWLNVRSNSFFICDRNPINPSVVRSSEIKSDRSLSKSPRAQSDPDTDIPDSIPDVDIQDFIPEIAFTS